MFLLPVFQFLGCVVTINLKVPFLTIGQFRASIFFRSLLSHFFTAVFIISIIICTLLYGSQLSSMFHFVTIYRVLASYPCVPIVFQFMSKAPSTPPDNRPPAKSTPSLSNPNVVFSTPDDVNKEEQCGKKSAKSVCKQC